MWQTGNLWQLVTCDPDDPCDNGPVVTTSHLWWLWPMWRLITCDPLWPIWQRATFDDPGDNGSLVMTVTHVTPGHRDDRWHIWRVTCDDPWPMWQVTCDDPLPVNPCDNRSLWWPMTHMTSYLRWPMTHVTRLTIDLWHTCPATPWHALFMLSFSSATFRPITLPTEI